MKRPTATLLLTLGAVSLGLAACSEQTKEDGKAFAEGAAADTAASGSPCVKGAERR